VRDLILLAALLGVVPLILRAPVVGLLVWIWITLMSPQREVFGFLSGFQLNLYVAALTAMAWLGSKERKVVHLNLLTVGLLLFAVWSCVTTYSALDRATAAPLCDRTVKSIILALAVAALANTRTRIQAVLWMVVVSLGYYGVKGGGFVLLTGGRSHVYGPDNTMIGDNNTLGLVLVVLLPLMNYLRVTSRLRTTRLGTLAAIVMTLLSIFGTYSRGALVALAAGGAAYAVRSRSGVLVILLAVLLAGFLPGVLPSSWLERMSTLQSPHQDDSFEGRVSAWRTSYNIAAARPLVGGGFAAVEQQAVVQRYSSPGSLKSGKAAHSIYFEVLGDQGFVGLGLYLLLLAAAWLNTFIALNACRTRPDLAWAGELARMLQVSLVAFMVGGAALSMAYYDGVLVLLALTAALAEVARQPLGEIRTAQPAPGWRRLPAGPPSLRPAR
jgi:putative inorganic carbon (HCO3(-)) transporter